MDVAECTVCGKPLNEEKVRRHALYCSQDCCRREASVRKRILDPLSGTLPTSTRGAVSELVVAADLMEQGFAVFRSLSPACPCDLAVLVKGGRLCRVEVRTGRFRSDGVPTCSFRVEDLGRFDVLAIRMPNEVMYLPPIQDWANGAKFDPSWVRSPGPPISSAA
jgi:hypothetical protein